MSEKLEHSETDSLYLLGHLRSAAYKAFDPLGFSLHEVMFLLYVQQGVVRAGELAKVLDMQPSAISTLITKLADQSLVIRGKDEKDARATRIHLTPKGRGALVRIKKAWSVQQESLNTVMQKA